MPNTRKTDGRSMVERPRIGATTTTKNTRNRLDKSRGDPRSVGSGGRFINGLGLPEIKIIVGVRGVQSELSLSLSL